MKRCAGLHSYQKVYPLEGIGSRQIDRARRAAAQRMARWTFEVAREKYGRGEHGSHSTTARSRSRPDDSVIPDPALPPREAPRLHASIEPFTLLLQAAGVLAVVLAEPVVVYQIWAFLAPALTKKERKALIPVLIAAAVLFALDSGVRAVRAEHHRLEVCLSRAAETRAGGGAC